MECQFCYNNTELQKVRVRLENYKICEDCICELQSLYEIEPII